MEIHTVLLYQTFVLLCFPLRFLLSSPLWWPGAEHGPWEALAPGHGQDAPWPHGAMRAMSSSWHWARCCWARERYGRLRVARGCGKRECIPARQDVRRRLASKISLDCIMQMPGCPGSEAFRAHNLARECWWLCEHVSSAFKRHVRYVAVWYLISAPGGAFVLLSLCSESFFVLHLLKS